MNPKLIKTGDEHKAALARIDALWTARPGTAEAEDLELWVHLVETYESDQYPIHMPNAVDAIKFRMDQQGLKPGDLTPYIGSKSKVSEVLNRKRPLSLSMIRNLNKGLGIPADVLLKESGQTLSPAYKNINWCDFPLAVMLRRAWFPEFKGRTNDLCEQAEEVLGPLLFPGGRDCRKITMASRQRIRNGSQADGFALWAWQARVLQLADDMKLGDYDPKAMTREFMRSVIGLSCLEDGPRQAGRMLAKSGIALIALNYLPSTHLDGAAMLCASGKPVVALTLRHDRLDNFWFTMGHEMAHVALHLVKGAKDVFLDDFDSDVVKDEKEKEADRFAADILIPAREWEKAEVRATAKAEDAHRLATLLHINAAIIAGRVRFEQNNYKLLDHLVGRRVVRKIFPHYMAGDVCNV